jgi:hypothetical protein
MSAFLFELELPAMTDDLLSMIPAQRECISALLVDGKVVSYSISQARNMLWCVIDSETEQEATDIILTFPFYPYFMDIVCHPLLFHSNLPVSFPGVSLN